MFMQAKAAIQGGRKGNVREKSALTKVNYDKQDNRIGRATNSSDSSRYVYWENSSTTPSFTHTSTHTCVMRWG